jgi:hypothetical protein
MHPAPTKDTADLAAGLTAWTRYADLNDAQRAAFGDYIQACEGVRDRAAFNHALRQRSQAALRTTGGDKLAALELLMASV